MGHIGKLVEFDEPAFIHESAYLYGKVRIGRGASIWPHVVTRAEVHEITIGARTHIQDFVMIHVGNHTPTVIGADCSITHHATLHGCEIADACLIGINATVMDGAKIGTGSIVAGHSIVQEGAEFPEHSVIAGVPARLVKRRNCTEDNFLNASMYFQMAKNMAEGRDRLITAEIEDIRLQNTDRL